MKYAIFFSMLITAVIYAPGSIAEEEEEAVELKLSELVTKGVVTEKVERRLIHNTLQSTSEIGFNENHRVVIAARTAGWTEKVAVFANQAVRKNQLLAEIYSPEFLSAQQEYLLIHARAQRPASEDKTLLTDAEQRLRILGLTDKKIRRLAATGKPYSFLPVHSPISGTIVSHKLNTGDTVKRGQALYVIANLSSLWANIALTESQLSQIKPQQKVSLIVKAYPKHRFNGKILSVGAKMDEATRTVKARALIYNPDRLLKAGMFADAQIETGAGEPILAVPNSAITQLQGQTNVFKVNGKELYAQPVETGITRGGMTEVKVGLVSGDIVATKGVFLLKSLLLKSQIGDAD